MALVTFDWRSIKRWGLLGTFVMVGWLMWPVATCSFDAFRETPLPAATPHDGQSVDGQVPDAEAVEEEPGFFSKLGGSIAACYRRTPLFGQEDYKTYLLVGFAALTVIAYAFAYHEAGKRRTFDS